MLLKKLLIFNWCSNWCFFLWS